MIKCPNCSSERVHKSGFNKSGTQRYICNECKRKFTPNAITMKTVKIKPREIIVKQPLNLPVNDLTCPYCGESNYKKSGLTRTGAQRYYCKSCKRRFTPGLTPVHPKMQEIKTLRNNLKELSCPYCDSKNLSKFGTSEKGVQRYQCKDCHKTFLDHYEQPQRCGTKPPKEQLLEIIRNEYLSGKTKKEIASRFGLCEKTIGTYTKGLERVKKEDKVPLLFKSKEEKNKIKKTLINKVEHEKKKEEKERKRLGKELLKQQKEEQLFQEKQVKEKQALLEKEKREKLELQKIIRQQKQKEELNKRREELEKRKEYINSLPFKRRDLISGDNKKKLEYLFYNYINNKLSKEEFDNSFNNLKFEIEEQINMSLEIEKSHVEYNIKKDILSGYKLDKVAEKYHKDISYIEDKAKEYYKTETISEHQKRLIIQYGVIMNTPVEYVAPYIPCSEHMFYKIINQYKDKKFKVPSVKLDKIVDDNILNDFIPRDKNVKSVD